MIAKKIYRSEWALYNTYVQHKCINIISHTLLLHLLLVSITVDEACSNDLTVSWDTTINDVITHLAKVQHQFLRSSLL